MKIQDQKSMDNSLLYQKMVDNIKITNNDVMEEEIPYKITISDEGLECYRENLKKFNNSISIDLEDSKIYKEFLSKSIIDITGLTKTEFHKKFRKMNTNIIETTGRKYSALDLSKNCFSVYSEMYDDIKRGYADGTREFWVVDSSAESGFRKITEEEELKALDSAFDFYAMVADAYVNYGMKNSERLEKAINSYRGVMDHQRQVTESYKRSEEDVQIEDIYMKLKSSGEEFKKGYSLLRKDNSFLFLQIFKKYFDTENKKNDHISNIVNN